MDELSTSSPNIRAFHDGPIGWIVLDRPARRNALCAAMWTAIPEAVAALDAHPNVKVIVVRGSGDAAFAAGADIAEFNETRSNATGAVDYERRHAAALAALRNSAKPSIAMIAGFCLGGGVAVALACDLRIAAESAVFSLPPARLGLAYPLDALQDLLIAVSPSVAKELLFTAKRIGGQEAQAIGLINQVVAAAELENSVRAQCSNIAEGAPLTLKASRRAIDFLSGRPGAPSSETVRALIDECFDSADYAEGRAAFLEKRKPRFSGR